MDIASSNQYQTIELVSCDKAGNISKEVYDPESNAQVPASYRVLVTQNSFVQFINNTPLLVSVIVIIVAIAGLIVVLVKRKKDSKVDELTSAQVKDIYTGKTTKWADVK